MLRIVLAFLVVTLLAGCGGSAGQDQVVAAFYPLAVAAQAIAGPSVHVRNLTPSGAEPHDIELTPGDVAAVERASVVLYLSHRFQPSLEDAVGRASGRRVDVLRGLPLRAGDPHVWLDPVLYARIVKRIGTALGRPAAAARLSARVLVVARQYRDGLSRCARRAFVTTHAAFGYLAARYGLRQIPITGVDPESEPAPRRLAQLARLVREEHVRTVFFERLISPRLAETVARESGARTAVLDPIEGLTPQEASHGATYLSLMRQNLAALRAALGCR